MLVSIIHISDLHRDSGSRITNGALLESLRRDRERYPSGINPDVLVVSGDIAYGVASEDPAAEHKLKQQYAEALEFLGNYADTFLGGRRNNVVIVPGNHDVSLPHVMRSMEKVPLPYSEEKRRLLAQQVLEEQTRLRWNWNDFTVRRIVNSDEYDRRLESFASFYENFYQGKRKFSLAPAEQYAIHDYPEFGIVIAALSSCHDNDPLNRTGRIHPECVAAVTRRIAELSGFGRIPIAVWHHSVYGGPRDTDYVDVDVLQSLMDGDFLLGLHGHQHRPQVVEHRFAPDRKRHMTLVSAGTLCGGPRALPTGRMRAYNLLSIDNEAMECTVHVRDMQNSDFSLPVWGPAYMADFGDSFIRFPIPPRPRTISLVQVLAQADKLLREGAHQDAYGRVRPHLSDAIARRIAIRALTDLSDWHEIANVFSTPQTAEEFMALAEANYELGRKAELAALLNSEFAVGSNDPAVVQCIAMMRNRLARV